MTKKELRKIYLQRRISLSVPVYRRLSRKLCNRFFRDVDLSAVRILHLYLGMDAKKEPDTRLLVTRLQDEFPHVHIAVPRVISSTEIENVLLERGLRVKKSKLGIPEPVGGKVVSAPDIDLVIVPLLCFDRAGYRVGYGAGYYDRFLEQCRPDCERLGLSFFDPVDAIPDRDNHDISLTTALTPAKTFVF